MKKYFMFAMALILALAIGLAGVRSARAAGEDVSVLAFHYADTTVLPNYAAVWMSTRYMPEMKTPTTAMYYWLIRTGTRNILVDTGVGSNSPVAKRLDNYVGPEELLGRVGLKPADIDTVIVTHGHWDHLDGIDHFKNAKVYVQRECYRFVTEAGAEHNLLRKTGYPTRKDSFALLTLLWDNRLKLIDGEAELFPGIKVIRVDGHHPGLQLVVVKTKDKPVILANDAMHFYANYEQDHPMGLYFGNMVDILKGFQTIRALNGVAIPGHDPKVMTIYKQVQKDVYKIY